MKWFTLALSKAFDFSGRARRSEYWYYVLFMLLISIALMAVDFGAGLTFGHGAQRRGVLSTLAQLVFFIPGLSVTVRRLHDTNKSGAWIFVGCVPLLGALALLVFTLQDSDAADNNYGSNPKLRDG